MVHQNIFLIAFAVIFICFSILSDQHLWLSLHQCSEIFIRTSSLSVSLVRHYYKYNLYFKEKGKQLKIQIVLLHFFGAPCIKCESYEHTYIQLLKFWKTQNMHQAKSRLFCSFFITCKSVSDMVQMWHFLGLIFTEQLANKKRKKKEL